MGMPFPEARTGSLKASFTDGNYQRPVPEKPKPLLVPRRKYGARNRKFSQKGLRARKIWTQTRLKAGTGGAKEFCHKHLFPPFSECPLRTSNVPVSMLENTMVKKIQSLNPRFTFGGHWPHGAWVG